MLVTPEEIASLPSRYSQDHLGEHAIAHIRLFHPGARWVWYISEIDEDGLCFDLVQGFEEELGYFELEEMESNGVCRDRSFTPTPIKQLRRSR